ncbi:BTB/POZ domain-containing protein [Phanerochaete sordida]|uniref:BTB/POZ domain-containing protein n=1 Tax=Phanerochaete sordida TaxID=48140 RepID=A0A9P3G4P0_9APHY|nr:BTB/POZ domain-containing protein [Phanerochaete sordida]
MASSSSTLPHSQGKKRKLADDGAGPAPGAHPDLIRDERVWFADGNIIVRAGPGCTGDGLVYGFRCHSSVLAARSPVFADMFQLPNTAGEKFEGAECVDLPDAWEDVRGLLRYLYGSIDIQALVAPRHADTLKVIGGPLRLAAKYDMESVTRELVPVLERHWPSTYAGWVHAEKGFRLSHPGVVQITRERYQDPAAAVRLAMDLCLRSVLPAAFYDLSRISIRKPLRAVPHDRWADAALLSWEDMERLTIARERLARYLEEDLFRTIERSITDLMGHIGDVYGIRKHSCEGNLEKWWVRAHPVPGRAYSDGPLASLQGLAEALENEDSDDEYLTNVCRGCRRELAGELRLEAPDLWNKLPELFDLASLSFD